ncbi:DNA-processing protein DprA [Paludibacterium paludis]|uniref:Smf/DprA SLOG domain-containing protein n=1 Tax=Paludibacterium paludis TaxID=1225769 RepID=A0A918P062_9NEIS|nr:DNA-processing protein DprA [Paludibacterium paludis]GGY09747.1 hypothetical protein GCM10011289_10780 [Paludibacterium paludis]
MTPADHEAWLHLAFTRDLGASAALALVGRLGSARHALDASLSMLAPLIGHAAAEALHRRDAGGEVDAALEWAQQADCHLVSLDDDDYPARLAETVGPPLVMFARGRRELLARPSLAIVGSRNASTEGAGTAQDFAAALAGHGYTIVSGLAEGIDTAAHRGALEHEASTIAVTGTGIDRVYPASNHALAREIAERGLVLSELPLGSKPLQHHFPRRNRVIAGMSQGCLVVEASVRSGSLITARLALEAGREVMAIPGSIHNPQARGCHRLIKDGAKLVETVEDVMAEISPADR